MTAEHFGPIKYNPPGALASLAVALCSLLLTPSDSPADADKPSAPAPVSVDFHADIQPLLAAHCTKCHGPEKQKSKLRLDTPEGLLRGGESGEPVLVPGKSGDSHIIKLVTGADPDKVMPPKGERLNSDQVALLKAWIDQGAKMPGIDETALAIKTDHWSLQPVRRPPVPPSDDPFLANGIDNFILERLSAKGLKPSLRGSRESLIRRLYLVMHGLPPTPGEVAAFLSDRSPAAWDSLVARVLASPRYGERWGRHWLDVVRYADSNGFETNRERKTAYHYRDYVVAAFNEDKPYDQFIREQLAGDALDADAATGFLVAGPYDIVKSPDISLTLMQRQNELDDMVNTTGTAFLGLTLGCARCHNHKFDPVLQKDYYSLQAVFAGVTHGERELKLDIDEKIRPQLDELKQVLPLREESLRRLKELADSRVEPETENSLRSPVNALRNEEEFKPVKARAVRFSIQACNGEPCIDELEVYDPSGRNLAIGAKPTASGTLPGYEFHKLEHINDGKHGNGRSWISNTRGEGWVQLEFAQPETLSKIIWGRDREGHYTDRVATGYQIEASTNLKEWRLLASSTDRKPYQSKVDPNGFLARLSHEEAAAAQELQVEIKHLKSEIARLSDRPKAWAGVFSQPGPTHRLYRGDPFAKREELAPDGLTVLGSIGMAMDELEQERRLKLANWIARPDNPLTARVMVNRLWHYIFGTGLVATPSDLGANGVPPSHPELLDWLADEFVQSGWSIKHIQQLILTSSTFQQSSHPRPDPIAKDAASVYLWRFPPRRLEAEAIRDCILAVSGALDTRMGGPGFYLHRVQVENVMHYFPKEEFGPEEFRRMVYLFKIRQEQDAIFGSFDCPDGNQVMPMRGRSNTPLQALNLFNSRFVLQQAEILSKRLPQEASDDPAAQVGLAFQLAFARPPDRFEMDASVAMVREQDLQAFCRALYNTSEFLFIF